MKSLNIIISVIFFSLLLSCVMEEKADGYGNFEATEIMVSAEANGKLEFLKVTEGQILELGALVGMVDTLQLYLNKQQLLVTKNTVASRSGGVWSQVEVLKQQLGNAKIEQQRIQNMFADKAATQQQLDQANSQVELFKKQMSNVGTQNIPIIKEGKAIDAKIAQIDEQILSSEIRNPIQGSVLTKYAEPGEIVTFGKPLYKIANLNDMSLRVFVAQPQLANISIGREVSVKIDDGDTMKEYRGIIHWISANSEFTPKIIQTKEERVNLVYAVKVVVKNDGGLKIGMPAEMWFL